MQQLNASSTQAPRPEYSDEMIDKYRTINVDYDDWYQPVYESFKERMEAIGIEVDRIYFSGFWSQGDGACFEGRVRDWGKYLTHLGYDDATLIDTAVNCWHYTWKHSGHYYHSNSVSYDDGVFLPENPYLNWSLTEDDEFRAAVWDAAMERHDLLRLTEAIQEDLKSSMDDLYNELEEAYDDLTSDESVVEAMVANDVDPNELTEEEEEANGICSNHG
jgi:hypothetical protein